MDFPGSPWIWASIGAPSLGIALSFPLKSIVHSLSGREIPRSWASFGFVFGAVALASGACLLVFPGKETLSSVSLWIYSGIICLAGIAGGFFRKSVGIPLAGAVCVFLTLILVSLSGFSRLPENGGICTVSVGSASVAGYPVKIRRAENGMIPERVTLKGSEITIIYRIIEFGPVLSAFWGPTWIRAVSVSSGGTAAAEYGDSVSVIERLSGFPGKPPQPGAELNFFFARAFDVTVISAFPDFSEIVITYRNGTAEARANGW